MTYFISDIHGDKRAFLKMLKKISFDPFKDTLYIIGDIVDRGKYGLEILDFLKSWVDRDAVKLCKGNHELFLQMWLEGKLSEQRWIAYGGEDTLNKVLKYDKHQKEQLWMFLKELPLYYELDTKRFGSVVVTHSGFLADSCSYHEDGRIDVIGTIVRNASDDEYAFLISEDVHFVPASILKKLDHYLIIGHRPTFMIHEDGTNRIFRNDYFMDIDSGSGYPEAGGGLSCYCIDDDREYYIQSKFPGKASYRQGNSGTHPAL